MMFVYCGQLVCLVVGRLWLSIYLFSFLQLLAQLMAGEAPAHVHPCEMLSQFIELNEIMKPHLHAAFNLFKFLME